MAEGSIVFTSAGVTIKNSTYGDVKGYKYISAYYNVYNDKELTADQDDVYFFFSLTGSAGSGSGSFSITAVSEQSGRTFTFRNRTTTSTQSLNVFSDDSDYYYNATVQLGLETWYSNYTAVDIAENVSVPSLYVNTIDSIVAETSDPYAKGAGNNDGTGGTGGTGTFDWTSDSNPVPALPSISATDTGFMTLFTPSLSQIQSLASYLWTNLYQGILSGSLTAAVDALKEIVSNPYDAIMGLSIVPVTPTSAGSKEVKMYGVLSSGVTMPYAASQWVEVNCGTLLIENPLGSYLDYAPYTKVTSLFLPYIGTVSIDVDMIMGKTLGVVYHVDILSGQCTAYITIDGNVEFSYMGHCAVDCPITSSDYSGAISAGLGLVGSVSNIAGAAATGLATGGPLGAIGGALGGALSQSTSMANDVMGLKPDIKSGGGIGGAGGLLGTQTPYLIMIAPNLSVPRGQNTFTGYPCNITCTFSTITGYTQVEYIKLDGISATESEKEEIANLMKGGVYL